MSKEKTPLLRIKGNSLDDGPGIRSVVFFKGCPLSCLWCHNPEAQGMDPELSFTSTDCIGCGDCMEACPNDAVNPQSPGEIDRQRCLRCFACVPVCPSGARAQLGLKTSADRIVAEVMLDKPFMETSGGGVTFTGGEATMHLDLVTDVARQLKAHSIHTILETCGLFSLDRFATTLLPHLDTIYFDLKLHDSAEHKQYCGRTNEIILENFVALQKLSAKQGFDLLPRIPLIPGITDTPGNLSAWATFLKNHGATEVALLEYNPTWIEKLAHLGRTGSSMKDDRFTRFMTKAQIDRCHQIFHEKGIATGRNRP